MRRNEGEPRKNLVKRAWDAITRRGRKEPLQEPSPPEQSAPPEPLSPELQQFEQLGQEYLRAKQQKWAQARALQERAQLAETQRQQRETKERERLEDKKISEAKEGERRCKLLEQEVQEQQIDKRADRIKSVFWQNNQNIPVGIKTLSTFREVQQDDGSWDYREQAGRPSETEQDDGTWIHRSQAGRVLSYTYEDVAEYKTAWTEYWGDMELSGGRSTDYSAQGKQIENRTETLTFGIGFFGDRETIIQEARLYVSDEQLQEGVKAYFIHRRNQASLPDWQRESSTRYERIDEKSPTPPHITETYVIPSEHPEAKYIFESRLFAIVEKYDPDTVVEQANERRRSS